MNGNSGNLWKYEESSYLCKGKDFVINKSQVYDFYSGKYFVDRSDSYLL